jgi:hypothetical protein
MASRLPCLECAHLVEELASASFEVTAVQQDILAQGRETTSPEDAARLQFARRLAQEAFDALAEHSLSHETVPEDLRQSG